MGQENVFQFKPRKELIREGFKEKITSILHASTFEGSDEWEFDWDEREPPSLDILVPLEDGSLGPISVELSQSVADFITDFVEEDSQFPYLPNTMYADNRIIFQRKES